MTRVSPIHITKQPGNDDILNSFGIMGNEHFLHKWTFEEKTCGYTTTYDTILSDTRLLIRTNTTGFCVQNRTDISVFLRDIAEIRESRKIRTCCCACCIRCCRNPKFMEVRGTFGSHRFIIPKMDMILLQFEISVGIANHKLVRHYVF